MQKINAKELLKKYREGNCSDKELALLEEWYNQYSPATPMKLTDEEWAEDVFSIIKASDRSGNSGKKSTHWRWIAAACVLLCLYMGIGFFRGRPPIYQLAVKKYDINPGGNNAVLTLANGSQIVLNGRANGKLAMQDGTSVTKTGDGIVTYQSEPIADGSKAGSNTITTPAGGQYHLILSDGTNVFLNAASSISYPASFSGDHRIVQITGEAYFEVAHDRRRPFQVKCNGQTVQVLGTHFNINAYPEEPSIKTTLLQGSVEISVKGRSGKIKPGQQARVSNESILVANADTDQAIAWKNGDFIFNGEDLETVMRQIARWYNVSVIYKSHSDHGKLFATISRSKKLSEILQALEMNQNVHFKMEGRSVEVMP